MKKQGGRAGDVEREERRQGSQKSEGEVMMKKPKKKRNDEGRECLIKELKKKQVAGASLKCLDCWLENK